MTAGNFTNLSKVKHIARITNEVPDDEIQEFIDFVNQDILREHGYPVARIWTTVDEDRGSYYLNRKREPVYKIDRVLINGSLLPESSWTGNEGSGCVSIPDSVASSADGSVIKVDFIPNIYHNLATFMTAKDIIESQYLISSEGGEFPRTAWLTSKIKNIQNEIPGQVMYRSSKYSSWNPETGVYVEQSGLGEEIQ